MKTKSISRRLVAAALSLAVLMLNAAAFVQPGAHPEPEASPRLCVTFDQLTASTTYNTPGVNIFSEKGIDVSITDFVDGSGAADFDWAEIEAAAHFGSGNVAKLADVTLVFDFSNLANPPDSVRMQFLDRGGRASTEYVEANGANPFIGVMRQLTAPHTVAPGVTAHVTRLRGPSTARTGTLVLNGPVSSLRIGGDELSLDHVCAFVN